MQSLWNDDEARACGDDALKLRVYTSRLLGRNPALVLHGGGNTSVKVTETDFFGETQEVLYVKGSGWDLATIEAAGFAPVKRKVLLQLAAMEGLSDSVIAREQRAALLNPSAPDPSVEAILHALIPFKYVDHTHADAVVTITNTPDGEKYLREIYGDRALLVPYIMPGFPLAKAVYGRTRGLDWSKIEGIILLKHGVFTFADDARASYEHMITLVSQAEAFLNAAPRQQPHRAAHSGKSHPTPDPGQQSQGAAPLRREGNHTSSLYEVEKGPGSEVKLAQLRKAVSRAAGRALFARLNDSPEHAGFAALPDVADIATRGCLTPDHIIRTKRIPVVVSDDSMTEAVQRYAGEYQTYFGRHTDGTVTMLDPAPRWAVWRNVGTVTFGETLRAAEIAADVIDHTLPAILAAERLGGWQPLPEADLFRVEYWELEQAKLKLAKTLPPFSGKIALVTGAYSGIGKACAELLHQQGAAVLALDINPAIAAWQTPGLPGIVADVTDAEALEKAVRETVRHFGGLDIVVCNAGIFPPSMKIEEMQANQWERSLAINLTAQQRLMQYSIPFLRQGIDPTLIIIGSKNVPAPGPGAAAYSAAKAALTQLARVAALELAGDGIRVNTIHPDAVFDTGLWTPETLEKRAKSYGLTIEQYKTKNLLRAEITSLDVAKMVCALAGDAFLRTTGAQIPLDGGNDRVI